MRLRKVKNAIEKLCNGTQYFIKEPLSMKGKWHEIFEKKDSPLHIEIGCGKGQFITTLAQKNPEINFIAIEKYDSVLLRCLEKAQTLDLPNLRLALIDAEHLLDYFEAGEVQRIYINFSDPWPKYAHRKRRLTHQIFLHQYEIVLSKNGELFQKTDNRKLFEFSIESLNENNWLLSHISLDLHKDNEIENIETEFEHKWSQYGPIYRLEARKRV